LRGTAGTFAGDEKGKGTSVKNEAESTDAPERGGAIRSSEEGLVMRLERRDCVIQSAETVNCASRRSRLQ